MTRIVESIVTVLIISIVVFLFVRISGDPRLLLLPPEATSEEWEAKGKQLGLDKPVLVQYWNFLSGALRGDLGQSIFWHDPALDVFALRFPNSLKLALASFGFSIVIGLFVGIWSAVKMGGWFDNFGKIFALLGQSLPTFWVGIMLIFIFSVRFKWLPTSGMGGLKHIIMPAFTRGWFFIAAQARLTRSSMLDVLGAEYIKLARIKGVPEIMVILKHALKNALLPVLTMSALNFVRLLGGAIITEVVFAWPGVGRLIVDSIFARDYPVVQVCVLIFSVLFVATNLVVDILYAYIDPRIRYQ